MSAIPKVIHYCWFGKKPLPPLAVKCIASWRKYLPGYEIKEWNEDNFDVNIIPYTAEAYRAKKYAFVSDYARFWILYKHGGVYFDTDVEVIKPLDDILEQGPFMGCENAPDKTTVAPGLGMACNSGLGIYKEILDLYSTLTFINDGNILHTETVVHHTTGILVKHGLKNNHSEIQHICGINIYPQEYFCPDLLFLKLNGVTDKTHTIHHYAGTWTSKSNKIKIVIFHLILKSKFLSWLYAKVYRKV